MSDHALGIVVGLPVVLAALFLTSLHYRGETPAERAAARERENAALREALGAPNFNYLVLRARARWLGLTRRDRRIVQLLWVGLAALFVIGSAIEFTRSGLDVEGVVTGLVLAPVVIAAITLAVIFRMR